MPHEGASSLTDLLDPKRVDDYQIFVSMLLKDFSVSAKPSKRVLRPLLSPHAAGLPTVGPVDARKDL